MSENNMLSEHYLTADELFQRIGLLLDMAGQGSAMTNQLLHDTLVLLCGEALSNSREAFGNLFSQVDYLCRHCRLRTADAAAVQKMRRDSNQRGTLSEEDLRYDCRALALFVAAVFGVDIPASLVGRLPIGPQKTRKNVHAVDFRRIRCVIREVADSELTVVVDQSDGQNVVRVDYSKETYLQPLLHPGMQLNLLDVEAGLVLHPRLIVLEPDFLVDISSLARCFTDYGHHPLSYTVNRMAPAANSQAILLGQFAGNALDDIINQGENYKWSTTFKRSFAEKALEYCTCQDLNSKENFKVAAMRQTQNIQQIVDELFGQRVQPHLSGQAQTPQYDRHKAVLEPSFICEELGIQGRVDLMTTDFRMLVEQKSGSNYNIQQGRPNHFGSYQKEDHYVQLLLYYGVLDRNFRLAPGSIDIRLLYSKYALPGGLVVVNDYHELFCEAMRFRNKVVAQEMAMAREGFERILPQLRPDILNEKGLQTDFFKKWILPRLTEMTWPLQQLPHLEKLYYTRMMTFVYREQLASKVGTQEGKSGCMADLWNMPLAEKRETGNIYTGLSIIKKISSGPYTGFDLITLSVPKQGDDFLPNFRCGDMVYLYAYEEDREPDVTKALLFKASLVDISSQQLTVHLNDGQQNADVIEQVPYRLKNGIRPVFAIEHSGSDAGTTSAIRGLHELMTRSPRLLQLLLGQREPEVDASRKLSQSYHPSYDRIVEGAMQALDYYLLIGPPGTGKTSMALQFMVRECLALPVEEGDISTSVLLTAYTNRAVDEICGMLDGCNINYIRLGNEYTCDPRFRSHLLEQAIASTPQLAAIRQRLTEARVVVGTTSTLQNKSYLFDLKLFSMAIIDEASQILEPSIVGLLAMLQRHGHRTPFVLVGDYKQLPAVVQQNGALSRVDEPELQSIGLTDCRDSLFERLIRLERQHGRQHLVGLLDRQGRMHPDIAEFPNRMFYTAEHLQCVPLPHQLEPTVTPRMVFIPSSNDKATELSDKVNSDEARIVAHCLSSIYKAAPHSFDATRTVGVIVPYRNQIAMIRKEIELLGIEELNKVSIDTVERYQGSQRDNIIYSFTIRHRYQLDFLTDNSFVEDGRVIDRKLNVALTRARKCLIMTGCTDVLRLNPLFAKLIDSCHIVKIPSTNR